MVWVCVGVILVFLESAGCVLVLFEVLLGFMSVFWVSFEWCKSFVCIWMVLGILGISSEF
ncbi:hypothetical protein E2C01_004844 [Portunus trituberculatus]|uniref:Uncharacterized protein n=1 Tax=Portunus trituberculatus TaxID=210409 RepID=A0A5B7CV07_PORTR|nr:hypothetical protein [Portunus trituberculatus]